MRPPQALHGERGHSSRRGFSLLELIGVMAIIAILAAALAPAVFRQIHEAARTKEAADLSAMASALPLSIARSKTIPGAATWTAAVADALAVSPGTVTNTRSGFSRVFLIDPDLRIAGGGLPCTQTTNGTAWPTNARVMILSSVAAALPVASGTPSAASFNDIWNTPPKTVPSSWTWSGQGEDLVIQRINLEPLFHRLILANTDSRSTGQFSIEGSSPLSVPTSGGGWDAYYLDGTVIGLHDANGIVQARMILTSDASYVFDSGLWRSQIEEGRFPSGLLFSALVTDFLKSTRNPSAVFGSSQQALIEQMYTYMFVYVLWSNGNPCFGRAGSVNLAQVPQYLMLLQAQTMLADVSNNLIK